MKKKIQKRRIIKPILNCPFDKDPSKIDYKDTQTLKKYISTRGRIFSREKFGVSSICQRKLSLSIKRARFIALLPYTQYV